MFTRLRCDELVAESQALFDGLAALPDFAEQQARVDSPEFKKQLETLDRAVRVKRHMSILSSAVGHGAPAVPQARAGGCECPVVLRRRVVRRARCRATGAEPGGAAAG